MGIDLAAKTEADKAAHTAEIQRCKENERTLNMAIDQARVALETGRYELANQQAQRVLEIGSGKRCRWQF